MVFRFLSMWIYDLLTLVFSFFSILDANQLGRGFLSFLDICLYVPNKEIHGNPTVPWNSIGTYGTEKNIHTYIYICFHCILYSTFRYVHYIYIDHYTISNSQHTCNCSNLSTTGPNNEHQTYINNPWTTAGPRRVIPQFDAPKKRNFLSSAAALALSSSAFNLASWQNMTAGRNLPMAEVALIYPTSRLEEN